MCCSTNIKYSCSCHRRSCIRNCYTRKIKSNKIKPKNKCCCLCYTTNSKSGKDIEGVKYFSKCQ